jgi:hypothetical protein
VGFQTVPFGGEALLTAKNVDPYVVVLQLSGADRLATITATKRSITSTTPDQCSGSAQATVQID